MATATKVRLNKYDNLKGLAILLIVFGHCLYGLSGLPGTIRQGIYIFHLPIFFFVAGYFSRIRGDIVEKSIKRLLVPYIIFTIVSFLFCIPSYTQGTLFFNPYGGLWFLLALFAMKLVLPILDKFKYPIILTIILALIVGFIKIDGEVLFTTRTLSFLPIFMLGFRFNKYQREFYEKLSEYKKLYNVLSNKTVLILILAVLFGLSMFIGSYVSQTFVEMAHSYDPSDLFNSVWTRFLIIVIGICTTLILNSFMTNNKTFLTQFGRNSLAVYLLHILFSNLAILSASKMGIINSTPNPILYLLFAIASTFIITIVFSREPITRVLNQIFDSTTDIFAAILREFKYPLEKSSKCVEIANSIKRSYYKYYIGENHVEKY